MLKGLKWYVTKVADGIYLCCIADIHSAIGATEWEATKAAIQEYKKSLQK